MEKLNVENLVKFKMKSSLIDYKTSFQILNEKTFQLFKGKLMGVMECQEEKELTPGLILSDKIILSPDYDSMETTYEKRITEWNFTKKPFEMVITPKDDGEIFINIPTNLNLSKITKLFHSINKILAEINTLERKGFLNVINLNHTDFKFIHPYLKTLLKYKVDETKKLSKEWNISSGKETIEVYKWTYNFLMLNLYYITLECLHTLDLLEKEKEKGNLSNIRNIPNITKYKEWGGDNEESFSDLQSDLQNLNKILYGKIDPSLRNQIHKRGVTILQNIYTGFDTEYINQDVKSNRMLSAQLAVSTHTFIKIPVKKVYSLGTLGTLNQQEFIQKRFDKGSYNFHKVENSLNGLINKIRKVRFNNHDQSINILIDGLIQKGYKYYEKDNFYIFSIPITPIEKYIYYTEGKNYSFKEMVNQSNLMGEPHLVKSYDLIISELYEIYKLGDTNVKDFEFEIETISESKSESEPKFESNSESDSELESEPEPKYELDLKSNSNSNSTSELEIEIESEDFTIPTYKEAIVETGSSEIVSGSINFKPSIKTLSRKYMTNLATGKISVTTYKTNYFIGHLTQADLSLLSDFEEIKENLHIVNKSFITLGKPFQFQNSNIQIRDTMLLAPGGSKALASIGRLYGEAFHKIYLSKDEISDMEKFLIVNKTKYQEYAIRDAEITLIHALWTEHFNFSINGIGIPITLSSLGSNYVKYQWKVMKYEGYQIHPKILIGDANAVQTPIGLYHSPEIGLKLSLFISNYKGGRNESFMYGVDKERYWIDYDLISAYTTILSAAGDPLYKKGRSLSKEQLQKMSQDELLFSYTIIKGTFKFPENVKYPSIPCYVNETTTVYPLHGSCILTGSEYSLAEAQGCVITVEECYHVPFSPGNKPFEKIITKIQKMRRDYKKGTISNLFYKEMGNSIYGNVVKGMSDKRKFDIKTKKTIRMDASSLSNPLIASWTTAFIRSIIGECLHAIDLLKGYVVSVTTDGFITDIPNLEEILCADFVSNSKSDSGSFKPTLLKHFKKIRNQLSGDSNSLEIKTEGKGIISWTTRGQLGIESQIKATTGFQSRSFTNSELASIFIKKMSSEEKFFEFVQFSLRSAKDIYLKGGHVTPVYRDQIFRIQFDNRRKILLGEEFKDDFDWSAKLLDSEPVKNVGECETLRFLSKLHKTRIYNKNLNSLSTNTIKKYEDLAIRNFIKVYFNFPKEYGLNGDEFSNYAAIINFVKEFKPNYKISKSGISSLRNRKLIFRPTPRMKDTTSFVDYVKTKYPEFKANEFFEVLKI
jgi:hypothetical protein